MRIRLSQPPAGDWLAGDWAELGNYGQMHTRRDRWASLAAVAAKNDQMR